MGDQTPVSPDSSLSYAEGHVPVMRREVLEALLPQDGETYIDGTFGAGGYSRSILESASSCRLLAIDRDPEAVRAGDLLKKEFSERFLLVCGRYSDMAEYVSQHALGSVNGIVLDLGISSMQVDDGRRGFSFLHDGPLDMRMGSSEVSAFDVVNQADEGDLADILFVLGEERRARAVARAIVRARKRKPIERTRELAEIVSLAVRVGKKSQKHPATRTFQALRIYINDELGELERGLWACESLLHADGRLVIVTFHSLEDRLVKQFFAEASGKDTGRSRHLPEVKRTDSPTFVNVARKKDPDLSEIRLNPRARSAHLRSATRSCAPARKKEKYSTSLPSLPPLSLYQNTGGKR